jgi:hypothetical protein
MVTAFCGLKVPYGRENDFSGGCRQRAPQSAGKMAHRASYGSEEIG